jgi:molecular chaperone DnaK (HSP70)
MMANKNNNTIADVENSVRDVRNWLATFKIEYSLSDEAYEKLHDKIEEIGARIGDIKEAGGKVDASTVKPAANALRDAKNWLAVFIEENDLDEEAVDVLHEKFDEIGQKLGKVK